MLHSRRALLQALPAGLAGLALTSPFWSRLLRTAVAQDLPRQRLIVWYTADGTVPEWFWPANPGALTIRSDRTNDFSGRDFNQSIPAADRPTFLLQPIAGYADRTLLVRGISSGGDNDHAPAVRSVLTGENAGPDDSGSSPSLDALVSEVQANNSHAEPVFRTGVYGNRVSYGGTRDLSRPRGRSFIEPSWQPQSDARRVLDAVGGGAAPDTGVNARNLSRLAVLGSVRERVQALKCAAGTPAAERLEAYVEEVARLERLESEMRPSTTPTGPLVDPNEPGLTGAQSDISSLPQMAPFVRDLAVTALALDYAPVATIQWGASGMNNIQNGRLTDSRYDFLPDFEHPGAGDHGLAHPEDGAFQDAGANVTAQSSTRDRVRVFRWFFGQLNLMLDRLKSIPSGTGTLLDYTTVLCVSEYGGPNANSLNAQHSTRNLPYLMVAGSQTPFRTGQFLNAERSHGDYLLTLAQALGSTTERMGVGTRTIDGIVR